MPAVNRYYSSVAVDTTLKFAITDPDGTSFEVNSTAGFPTSYPYTLAIGYDSSNEELVTIIGASGGILTVGQTVAGGPSAAGRGVDGTNNQTHTAGETVKHVISARDMTETQAHIAAETNIHGLGVGVSPAPSASPTFTGTVVLPSTTSIGSVSSTEIGYLDGVTSAIQTQLNTKAPNADPTFTGTVVLPSTTSIGSVSATELGYVDGVTSAIQTQLNTNTPVGSITMWALATAPTGWQLCNGDAAATAALSTVLGTANVPDMRGFVPVGFKTSDDAFGTLKGTGGSKTSTAAHTHGLASHSHTINHDHGSFGTTDGAGSHDHTTAFAGELTSSLSGTSQTLYRLDPSQNYLYPATDADGAHNHTIDVPNFNGSSGGPSDNTSGGSSVGATNGNLQPYFTLNFIIKF